MAPQNPLVDHHVPDHMATLLGIQCLFWWQTQISYTSGYIYHYTLQIRKNIVYPRYPYQKYEIYPLKLLICSIPHNTSQMYLLNMNDHAIPM